ncbi:MAG: DUF2007 domain-containing protein [Candidatus Kapabacteria bacterium]|nr:DUF2007 domain-containing protein [Candidatus Kapabacteria bacterium]
MDLVTIATFNSSAEAHVAQDYLKVHNITSYIADENTTNLTINLSGASGYSDVKIRVKEHDAEKAAQLIQQLRNGNSNNHLKAERKVVTIPKEEEVKNCPVCNSDSVEKTGYNLYVVIVAVVFVNVFYFFADYALIIAVVGLISVALIIYILRMERYTCYSCHHLWRVKREG